MAEFKSDLAYTWFAREVMQKCRFVHSDDVRAFLRMVQETSASRVAYFKIGKVYYRAQQGCDLRTFERAWYGSDVMHKFQRQTAFSANRMRPRAEYVGDGRANPGGIPFLYMATTPTTAMAEVRPWLGAPVSVARFGLVKDVSLVDCSRDARRESYRARRHLTANEKEAFVWGEIAHAFSKPVASDERRSDYVPTQILAEAFRSHPYDGIIYNSLLKKGGKNVVLFDPRAAEPRSLQLFETKALSFKFKQREGQRPAKRNNDPET